MGVTQTKIGLKKQSFQDRAWQTELNNGMDDAETRLTRSGTADPNVAEQSFWIGQRYWQTDAFAWWVALDIANPGEWIREIPQLTISMYAGDLTPANLPKGWVPADGGTTVLVAGSVVTPDLSGKFIVGHDPGDPDYDSVSPVSAADKGGSKDHQLTIAEAPTIDNHTDNTGNATGATDGGGSGPKNPTLAHTHSLNLAHTSPGPGDAHENRPQYYMLAYLCKL